MARKKFTTEQIIQMLRKAEIMLKRIVLLLKSVSAKLGEAQSL